MTRPFRRFWPAILLIAPFAAGCEGPSPEAYATSAGKVSSSSAVPIGTNEAGEPCRYQLASGALLRGTARREAVLFCGNWEQPSALVAGIARGPGAAQVEAHDT